MIDRRKQGLHSIQTVIGIVANVACFYLLAALFIYVIQVMNHDFVKYPLYTLSIIASGFLAHYKIYHERMHFDEANRWVRAVRRANGQTVILAMVLFAVVWATKDKAISRIFLGLYILTTWGLTFANHLMLRERLAHFLFRGRNRTRTIFVGSSKSAPLVAGWRGNAEELGMEIIGLVSTKSNDDITDECIKVIGEESNLRQIINEHGIQQIILLETHISPAWVQEITGICVSEGCRLLVFNPWQEYFSQSLSTVSEGGHTFFTIQEEPLEDPINRLLKRLLDIAIALPLCLLVVPPLALMVMIMQARQSPGPLLYKQQRTGLFGYTFPIYKFRSMHVREAADDAKQASENDPRIYPFGEFLRKTSIDEFPQLINVLRGHMSLVGPRPHLASHDEWFRDVAGAYKTRQFVKPGITGLAQVRGMRGEIKDPEQIKDRVKLDIQYINTWSIWMDIGILTKTLLILFRPPPEAY